MDDLVQMLLTIFVRVPLVCWIVISPLLFIWWKLDQWLFHPDRRDRFFERHERVAAAVYVTAFIVLWVVLGQGIERLLFFIPKAWGWHDRQDHFVDARGFIAFALGLLVSCFFAYVVSSYGELREESRSWRITATVHKRLGELRGCTLRGLAEKRDEARAKLERLRAVGPSLSDGPDEMQVLEWFLEEVERQIRDTELRDSEDTE